jgi:hypothetical protein
MANVFFKVTADFKVENKNSPDQLAEDFAKVNEKAIKVFLVNEDGIQLSFNVGDQSLESGEFDVSLENGALHAQCNAIFKIAVKPAYFDRVLENVEQWYCDGVDGVYGVNEITGLEGETYTYMRFGVEEDDIRYKIPLKCAKKAKDLEG